MEFYTFLRHVADSWGLLAMSAFFIGSCLWVLRPGSKALHSEAANLIFRGDDSPLEDAKSARKEA